MIVLPFLQWNRPGWKLSCLTYFFFSPLYNKQNDVFCALKGFETVTATHTNKAMATSSMLNFFVAFIKYFFVKKKEKKKLSSSLKTAINKTTKDEITCTSRNA